MELLRGDSRLGSLIILLGTVHTGDIQTCETTLALAYMLCHLSATWLQFQRIERSLRWE